MFGNSKNYEEQTGQNIVELKNGNACGFFFPIVNKYRAKELFFKVVLSRVLLMAYSSILLEYVLDSTYS